MNAARLVRFGAALAALALVHALPPVARAEASDPARAIAIAEDERRWSDGELRGFLAHADAAVRARAALATGRLQDSTSVPALLSLLEDAEAAVRREAAFALGQIGHRSAREPLERALAAADPELRELALEALGKLQDRAATPAVVRLLADPAPALRRAAAVALWRLADSTAIDALLARDDDPDPEVRWRVIYALEKTPAPARIVLRAALHLMDDADPRVRASAARTIGRQKHPRGSAYLIGALADAEPAVVIQAIRGLQQIADSACGRCPTALAGRLGHGDPYVRVTAATALGDRFTWAAEDSARRHEVEAALAAALRDPDAATRGAAARALLLRRGAAALDSVAPVLADSSLYARVAAVGALRSAGPSVAVARLLAERAAPGHHALERATAAEAIGARRDDGGLALLREGLADTSALFVAACAGALAEAGDSASVPRLATALAAHAADADPDARISIRDALRDLAGRVVADSLERAHPAPPAPPREYAGDFAQPPAVKGAVLRTTRGEIEWRFHGAEAPQTVRNFAKLARTGYFDGLAVHRVVPDFVIQDGDPTGTGSGGPGWTIRCEYNRLRYDAGRVGMALSGKDTGGSQWFITHAPQPHLDGRYTIFASVVRGMDVVHRITQGDRVLAVTLIE
jgi:cyclophilin family peptidyl-prolyl cis-trans isomerase/HEAT repeat protein